MSSQYYRVTAYVGTPHRNAVEVTLPLVGPQGPAGPAGTGLETLTTQGDMLYQGASVGERLPIGTSGQILRVANGIPSWANESGAVTSVNGETGAVVLDAADLGLIPYKTISVDIDNTLEASPQIVDLLDQETTVSGTTVLYLAVTLNGVGTSENYARLVFPDFLPKNAIGRIVVMPKANAGKGEVYFQVRIEGGLQIFPISGYSGLTALDGSQYHNYEFVWTGSKWDLGIVPTSLNQIDAVIYTEKPSFGGLLMSWGPGAGGRPIPSTPTSTGIRGEVAVGTDIRDGIERFYICIADNKWRRVPIASW